MIRCTRLTAPLHGLFQPNFINVVPLRLKNRAEISRKLGQLAVYMNYQTRPRNNVNKSILKDLKKVENEYNILFDSIQENYIYREMLKYAKEKIEVYFEGTIL